MRTEPTYEQAFCIRGRDFINAGQVSSRIKSILREIGIDQDVIRRVAIASYEAEMNVVMYADEAQVYLTVTPALIRVIIQDKGQGIENIELAMQEGYSTATEEMREMGFGAGMGLPNIKKNSDSFELTSEPGKGSKVTIEIYTRGRD